jgi:hypothetical protein
LAGVIDGETAAEAGGYEFSSDSLVSGLLTAADSTNPRIDVVYVQVSDPSESDGSSVPKVDILYAAGSPAASPSAPATPARSFVLARINVPKANGGSPSVSWIAPYMAGASGEIGVANPSMLPAPAIGMRAWSYLDDSHFYTRVTNGNVRWVRTGGGTIRLTASQAVGNVSQSTVATWTVDSSASDNYGWAGLVGGGVSLSEGDYVATGVYVVGSSATGRSFVRLSVGAFRSAGTFGSGEDTASTSVNFHVSAAGGTIGMSVYQTTGGTQTGTFELYITKVG